MPAPGYQRELSTALSSRIARILLPATRCGVRSSRQEAYPYGQPPSRFPFSHTAAYDIAPSTSRKTDLVPSTSVAFAVKFFLYHPTPLLGSRPIPPLIPGALKGPAMAQSWGRLRLVQLASLKDACTYWTLAPGGVPEGT